MASSLFKHATRTEEDLFELKSLRIDHVIILADHAIIHLQDHQ